MWCVVGQQIIGVGLSVAEGREAQQEDPGYYLFHMHHLPLRDCLLRNGGFSKPHLYTLSITYLDKYQRFHTRLPQSIDC
jgi:hypothetical protein